MHSEKYIGIIYLTKIETVNLALKGKSNEVYKSFVISSSGTAPNGPLTKRIFLKGVEFQKIQFSLDEHSPQVSRI